MTRRVLKDSRTNLALEDRFLIFNNCIQIAREELDNFFSSEGSSWAHCLKNSRDAQLLELASLSILVDEKLEWDSLQANLIQMEATLWRTMNSVFFDIPSRVASYKKLKAARLLSLKSLRLAVQNWDLEEFKNDMLQQLSSLQQLLRSNDFKVSMKDHTTIPLGFQFGEIVTQAIILIHKYRATTNKQAESTRGRVELTTTPIIQFEPESNLGEKSLPNCLSFETTAAKLVENHPTRSFSPNLILVSPKEDMFFETVPTMPSIQAAIFEAATFRPCPLNVTNLEQSEWDTPHEFQPQPAPPTQLRHTTTLSVHCVLKEGGSTQPTLRTAVLEGLYEWIDDQLEPITPIPISLRTKTFDPFLEAPPERPTLEYIISHQLPFQPLPVNQIRRATLLYGKIPSYCKSLIPNIPCFLPWWPPAHFAPRTQAQLERAILKCRTEAHFAACWEIDKELHPPHIPPKQLSPSFFRHLAVRYTYPHPVTDLIKPAPLRHKWKKTSLGWTLKSKSHLGIR